MKSRNDDSRKLIWYDVDEKTNRKVWKTVILTGDMENILLDLWERGVFYINPFINYGKPLCEKAIEAAKQLDPPQFINYRTLRVSWYKTSSPSQKRQELRKKEHTSTRDGEAETKDEKI